MSPMNNDVFDEINSTGLDELLRIKKRIVETAVKSDGVYWHADTAVILRVIDKRLKELGVKVDDGRPAPKNHAIRKKSDERP